MAFDMVSTSARLNRRETRLLHKMAELANSTADHIALAIASYHEKLVAQQLAPPTSDPLKAGLARIRRNEHLIGAKP